MNWHKYNTDPTIIDLAALRSGREEMFRRFVDFATERMMIFHRRVNDLPEARWTNDPVFQKYKFTNCYRILDRVSQYLIKRISNKDLTPYVCFGQTYLFKVFNNIETWKPCPWALNTQNPSGRLTLFNNGPKSA